MRIKINRKLLKEDVAHEIQEKLEQTKHLQETLSFLNPEWSDEQVNTKLIYQLALMADPKILSEVVKHFNSLGEKKVDEVTDLYCNFFSEDSTDNNN